ncbi:ABC transporter ATP-binding protein [Nocardioides sp. 1609]|uniref:sulfate/molybdate ABC transporter ATP-binding protein n=1 Tax=Nocardioides sp. 1609 TaxID=2508327 RepID=UPI00106F2B6F|nr:ABC transporter ATP-binding protein [Nocardioides sp. 1609]
MSLEVSARVVERGVDLSFSVGTGETVAILGPNGAGKSTVLSVLAGLLRPDEGRVVLDGRPLTEVGGGRAAVDVPPHRRGIALLAQDPLLFPHLSALDNVAFGPRSGGASRSESREQASGWLERVAVGHLGDRRPSRLSGGQAQRVAVARALAARPDLLLLDEPMAALDVDVRPALRHTLREVLAERTTVVVTHDVLDALLLADRVVVVEDGTVVEDGASADVLARPRSAFAARLAGLNLLAGRWDDGAVRLGAGAVVQGRVVGPAPAPGDSVLAVFRPTAVSIYREPPHGSPRNVLDTTVTHVEPRGDLIRIRSDLISADVTAQAAAELALVPGDRVVLSVKATEVSVYLH